jgi:hypothetical protein
MKTKSSKKSSRKLDLIRETLRDLDARELRAVHGGAGDSGVGGKTDPTYMVENWSEK